MGVLSQFCMMKRVLDRDGGDNCIAMCMCLVLLSCTLKNA